MKDVRSYGVGIVFAIMLFAVVLYVHAAIPGVTLPTLGQAIWTASFAQSFANAGVFSIHALNFGIPKPAAISFGLSGALPCAWLIDLGMAPLTAYTTTFSLWLGVAYLGAIAVCRRVGTNPWIACLLSALWLCLPIVVRHEGYSMLCLGIALLPAYMWTVLRYLDERSIRSGGLLVAGAIVSAFMDGYTFVMFAAGAAVLFLSRFVGAKERAERRGLALALVTIYLVSFGLAAALYKHYVNGGDYGTAPLSMFRAWGMDAAFAWLPTSGEFWLWDVLHIGQIRNENIMFGDRSVWICTFGAPLLVASGYAAWRCRKHPLTAWLLVIAVAGLYLSLGPSLKVNSRKPPGVTSPLMTEESAITRTHTAYVTTHLPAIRMMRAPYRWAALGYFACWMLVVVFCARPRPAAGWRDAALLIILLAMVFPHPRERLREGLAHRRMADAIEMDWIGGLRKAGAGPTTAFVPYGNDFLAAYAAARLDIRTYNVGGDKNFDQAFAEWPSAMVNLNPSQPAFADLAPYFLLKGLGDQLIVPYVDLLRSALSWPCFEEGGADVDLSPPTKCVESQKANYAPMLAELRKSPYLDINDGPFFATISLKPAYRDKATRDAATAAAISYPITMANQPRASRFVLTSGWHPEEPGVRWSQAHARLTLPVPEECKGRICMVSLGFVAFAASPTRPVTVNASSLDHPERAATTSVTDSLLHKIELAIPGDRAAFSVALDVPNAASPAALGISIDARIIGVDLKTIDLRP